jgi:lysophospholipase L1-like esterase
MVSIRSVFVATAILATMLSCLATIPTTDSISSKEPNAVSRGWLWEIEHKQMVSAQRNSDSQLVFIGDSITQGWSEHKDILESYFGKYKPTFFGMGGDKIQNLHWRLGEEHCELAGIHCRVVVVLIGFNNWNSDAPDASLKMIKEVVKLLSSREPKSKILLLAVLPSEYATSIDKQTGIRRLWTLKYNELLKGLASKDVVVLNVGEHFIKPNAKTIPELYVDEVHLSKAGYDTLAKAIKPTVDEMMR